MTNYNFIKILRKHMDSIKEYEDLIFLINKFETSIHNRQGHYIKLDIRYLMEWIFKKTSIVNYLVKDGVIEKENRNHFTDLKYENLRKLSNDLVHYNVDTHITIRSKSFAKTLSLDEMINFAELFYDILVVFTKNFKSPIIQKFDKKIYEDGKHSFYSLGKDNKMLSKENSECKICDKGIIKKPKNKTFPFGPYLQCNRKECNAILSMNMNLKIKTDKTCPECINKGNLSFEVKRTFSYYEDKKYFECINCGYRFDDDENEVDYYDILGNNAYLYDN